MELRCRSKLHGVLDKGLVEVKCRSKWCGAGPGRVVLHRFDTSTGELVETKQFKDPERSLRDVAVDCSPVRPS